MPERPHLAYPVELSSTGQLLAVEQDSDREVADCIAISLIWPLGTKRGDPSFGSPSQLFQSGGPDLEQIRESVSRNEPRAAEVEDEVVSQARGIATVALGFDQKGGASE